MVYAGLMNENNTAYFCWTFQDAGKNAADIV